MNAFARPTTRVALGAVAALALGAGLAPAASATAAQAADRPTRAARPAATLATGQVESRLVVVGTDLSVSSAVGPSTENSYVESTLDGRLTLACFTDGAVVAGTTVDDGRVRTGSLEGTPWNDSGYDVDVVAAPAATTTVVSAPVVLKNILRDRAGDLSKLDCASGSTAGFYRYQVSHLASARYAFDGTVTGTHTSRPKVSYYFAAPLY